jgi:nicotinamide riboside kinase
MSEQIARENAALIAAHGRHPLVALDSVPLATALYSQLYFADAKLLGRASAHHQRYDVTLVTDIDLPWEADGLQRDGPDMRARFHDLLLDWLARERMPFTLVSGRDADRIDIALARTRHHISKALPDDR